MSADWFKVDREGLRQLVAGRSKGFVVAELTANAWDEDAVTRVEVVLSRVGTRSWCVTVRDDSPTGFADLADTFTLYKPSSKKTNAILRGRFNLGEKLVLALCSEAIITTTSGGVRFDAKGRHRVTKREERGSVFAGTMPMTLDEVEQMRELFARLISPPGKATTFAIVDRDARRDCDPEPRTLFKRFSAYLPTVLADESGVLRDGYRHGDVELYAKPDGRKAWVYELGIPVVELDGAEKWDVNVMQKVPLTKERDAVTSGLLSMLRAAVLNETIAALTDEDAGAAWVTGAAESFMANRETVVAVVAKRFGEKRVSYDPSDLEANMKATANGYNVVHGGSMSASLWDRARSAEAILPAGRLFPTPAVHEMDGGVPEISQDERTPDQLRFLETARLVAEWLLKKPIRVRLFDATTLQCIAYYRPGVLAFNFARGEDFSAFAAGDVKPLLSTLLHECAHDAEGNHLSEKFHDEICRLGAYLAVTAHKLDLGMELVA